MANKIICSRSINFPSIEDQFPQRAECSPSIANGIVHRSIINVPNIDKISSITYESTIPAFNVTLQSPVVSGDNVQGQTLRFDNVNGGTVCFEVIGTPCPEGLEVCVELPTENNCTVSPDFKDPCSCSIRQTFNGQEYYQETLTYTVSDSHGFSSGSIFSDFSFTTVVGDLLSVTGTPINNAIDLLSVSDVESQSVTVTFWVRGQYGIVARANVTEEDSVVWAHVKTCLFTCECPIQIEPITPGELCRDATFVTIPYTTTGASSVNIQITGNALTSVNNTATFVNQAPVGNIVVPINVSGVSQTTIEVVIDGISSDGTCTDRASSTMVLDVLQSISCDNVCGQQTNCDGSITDCGSTILETICDEPVCPDGVPFGQTQVIVNCVARVVNDAGQLCHALPSTMTSTITCGTQPTCPDCTIFNPTTGNCDLASNAACSSLHPCSTGTCNTNTCSCTGNAVVQGCTDNSACNFNPLANSDNGSCQYCNNCQSCVGTGQSASCGTATLNCPDGSTSTSCAGCNQGTLTQNGCDCLEAGSPCLGECTNIPECQTCSCNNATGITTTGNLPNSTSCGSTNCGQCIDGTCQGDVLLDDGTNTCCEFNSLGCCDATVQTCGGIQQCGPCAACSNIEPTISQTCLNTGSIEITISGNGPASGCDCILNIWEDSIQLVTNQAWTGSNYTYTTSNFSAASTATITCNPI